MNWQLTSIFLEFTTNRRHINSLCTMRVLVSMLFPPLELALHLYCPLWDVLTGLSSSVLVYVVVQSSVVFFWMLPLMIAPSGRVHCTDSESPTVRMTLHVREKVSPAVCVPGGETVVLGGGTEGCKE